MPFFLERKTTFVLKKCVTDEQIDGRTNPLIEMQLRQSKDFDCYEKGRKKMGFGRSKDLDYYEKGRKKMVFGQSKDLDC